MSASESVVEFSSWMIRYSIFIAKKFRHPFILSWWGNLSFGSSNLKSTKLIVLQEGKDLKMLSSGQLIGSSK